MNSVCHRSEADASSHVGSRALPGLVSHPAPRPKRGSLNILRKAISVLASTLREIFDESAYRRFLARQGTTSSPAAYAAFMHEYAEMKARRPRCC